MGTFKDIPRAVWMLVLGIFFNSVVAFTFLYLFVYLTDERGMSVPQAGVLTGIGGVGLVAGNFTGGWFGDRFGHRRALLCAAVLSGVTLVLLPLIPIAALYALLPLCNYAQGAVRACNGALVAVTVPDAVRRQGFALMRSASNAGFTVGAPLGALLATQFSYTVIFVADGVGTLLFAVYAARVLPARGRERAKPGPGEQRGLWRELRARPAVAVLLVASFFADIVYRQLFSTYPVFLTDHGHATQVYGWMFSINGGLILLLELPVTAALRKRPPLAIVGAGLMLVGLGYGLLMFGAGLALAAATMLLITLGEILYKTPANAYVADQAPAHAQGRFQSLYAGVSVSGVVLAPPLGGALYEAAPGVLWPLCTVVAVLAGCAVVGAGRMRPRSLAGRTGVGAGVPVPSRSAGTREGTGA
ncbi:MFS transporter [Streptomyces sp. NBC_00237]|uniref:MFS transporter n=1 Tax=Streptomyces sp. NBC_00237 TaxID=2975687 RepID=UPI0022566230|nr:MFS transporter [Streptomyces sp. NBC_00237]MCX5201983.1 MFS transporter [Streptomyces sp. NBC_00237]